MMKLRGLIIAMVLLAALVGALYWSNRHPESSETASALTPAAPKILSVNESDLTKVDLRKNNGDQLALARNGSGAWEILAPKPMTADQSAVSSMLGTFSSLNSERLVEDKAADLASYGLSKPALEVDLTQKTNKTQKLLIGDDTPAGNGAYAMLAGDPRVFTIASYTKTSIDKTANDLRDKRLITLDPDKISRVELVANKQDLEFGRNKEDWQILKPKPLRADSTLVGDLVTKITSARMDTSTSTDDAKKAASAFSSGKPVATAKLTSESGTQQLDVRKNKDDYYAKSSVVQGVYKVTSDIGQALDKKLDDFRNKKLFDFGFDDPNKVELHDGTKSYFLTRKGDDWWDAAGKKLDSSSVQPFMANIRGLAATGFVESGFTSPLMEMTVTSNDGKRVEKVQVAKSGNDYLARREGDSSLYQLDPSAIPDLQKSAADLKPAAESSSQVKK
ncbi:MAG TPA: DUF4340 domain-containing protein [Terriglobales bacterium]